MQIVKTALIVFVLFLTNLYPNSVSAEVSEPPLPFLPEDDPTEIKESNFELDFEGMSGTLTSVGAVAYKFFLYAMAIIFLIGLVFLIYGMITKHGERSKTGRNLLWSSFLVMITMRVVPIIILTTRGLESTLIIRDFMTLALSIGTYISIGSAVAGVALYGMGRMINHPSYERWGKGLGVGAVMGVLLTNIAPYIFTLN
jgi:hypothetical protein